MAVVIRSMQQAALTTGGPTQDYEISGAFTTAEPLKAALIWLSPSTTAGTSTAHARYSIGFTDGTRQRCLTIRSRDNNATSSCIRNGLDTRVAQIYSGTATTVQASASLSSITSAKLVLSWDTLATSAWLVNCLQFGGSDLQVYCDSFAASGTQDAEVTVTAPGFQPDMILFISRGSTAFTGTQNNHATISIGVSTNEGGTIKNGCFGFVDENGAATGAQVGAIINNNRCLNFVTNGAPPVLSASGEVIEYNSSGFKYTTRDVTGVSCHVGYLALKFNGKLQGYGQYIVDTLTATGTHDWTTPSHAPQAVYGIYSQLTATNTLVTGTTAGAWGVGAMTGASEEFCASYMTEDALTPTNCNSLTSAIGHEIPLPTAAAGTAFDLTSFDEVGANFNYTSVIAAASRKLLLVSFGRPKVFAETKATGSGKTKVESKLKSRVESKLKGTGRTKSENRVRYRAETRTTGAATSKNEARRRARAEAFSRHSGLTKAAVSIVASFIVALEAKTRGAVLDLANALVRKRGLLFSIGEANLKVAPRLIKEAQAKAVTFVTDKAEQRLIKEAQTKAVASSVDKATEATRKEAQSRVVSSAVDKATEATRKEAQSKAVSAALDQAAPRLLKEAQAKTASYALDKVAAKLIREAEAKAVASSVDKATKGTRKEAQAKVVSAALDKATEATRKEAQSKIIAAALDQVAQRLIKEAQAKTTSSALDKTAPRLIKEAEAKASSAGETKVEERVRSRTEAKAIGAGNTKAEEKVTRKAEAKSVNAGRTKLEGKVTARAESKTTGAARLKNEARKIARASVFSKHSGLSKASVSILGAFIVAIQAKALGAVANLATALARKRMSAYSVGEANPTNAPRIKKEAQAKTASSALDKTAPRLLKEAQARAVNAALDKTAPRLVKEAQARTVSAALDKATEATRKEAQAKTTSSALDKVAPRLLKEAQAKSGASALDKVASRIIKEAQTKAVASALDKATEATRKEAQARIVAAALDKAEQSERKRLELITKSASVTTNAASVRKRSELKAVASGKDKAEARALKKLESKISGASTSRGQFSIKLRLVAAMAAMGFGKTAPRKLAKEEVQAIGSSKDKAQFSLRSRITGQTSAAGLDKAQAYKRAGLQSKMTSSVRSVAFQVLTNLQQLLVRAISGAKAVATSRNRPRIQSSLTPGDRASVAARATKRLVATDKGASVGSSANRLTIRLIQTTTGSGKSHSRLYRKFPTEGKAVPYALAKAGAIRRARIESQLSNFGRAKTEGRKVARLQTSVRGSGLSPSSVIRRVRAFVRTLISGITKGILIPPRTSVPKVIIVNRTKDIQKIYRTKEAIEVERVNAVNTIYRTKEAIEVKRPSESLTIDEPD